MILQALHHNKSVVQGKPFVLKYKYEDRDEFFGKIDFGHDCLL